MMRVLVVDDEPLARQNLIAMLAGVVEVVGEVGDGATALEKILDLGPDAVFLDVEMPRMNGFEVLAQLSDPPPTVFVTAYDHYAIRAFEVHAVDYLLKPLRRDRVLATVQRIQSHSISKQALQSLLKHVPGTIKIAGRRGNKVVLCAPAEVIWIGVEDRLVFLHTALERFLTNRTIAEFEAMLAARGFFRVSRAEIVNLQHARELTPGSSGTWDLVLSNGHAVEVSRERGRELRAALGF